MSKHYLCFLCFSFSKLWLLCLVSPPSLNGLDFRCNWWLNRIHSTRIVSKRLFWCKSSSELILDETSTILKWNITWCSKRGAFYEPKLWRALTSKILICLSFALDMLLKWSRQLLGCISFEERITWSCRNNGSTTGNTLLSLSINQNWTMTSRCCRSAAVALCNSR